MNYNYTTNHRHLDKCYHLKRTNVFRAWQLLGSRGSSSIKIAICDSGLDPKVLKSSITGELQIPSNSNYPTGNGTYSHGVSTWSVVMHDGIGVCPDCTGIFRSSDASSVAYAIETDGAHITSLSYDGDYTYVDTIDPALLSSQGLFVVSAGNDASYGLGDLASSGIGIVVGSAGGPQPHIYDIPSNGLDNKGTGMTVVNGVVNYSSNQGDIAAPAQDVFMMANTFNELQGQYLTGFGGSSNYKEFGEDGNNFDITPWYGDGPNFWYAGSIGGTVEINGQQVKGGPRIEHHASTSFSTPTVAGILALIWSANPSLTRSQVESILLTTANKSKHPDGYGIMTIADAGKGVLKAMSMANPSIVYPHLSFSGEGCQTTIEGGVAKTTLSGNVWIDIAGFKNGSDLSHVELWVDKAGTSELCIYSGPPIELHWSNAQPGTNLITVIGSDGVTSVEETYDDIFVGFISQKSVIDTKSTSSSINTNYFCTNIQNAKVHLQWHHYRSNAFHAWKYSIGDPTIKVGFVGSGITFSSRNISKLETSAFEKYSQTGGAIYDMGLGFNGYGGVVYPKDGNYYSDLMYSPHVIRYSPHDNNCLVGIFGEHGTNDYRGIAPNCSGIYVACNVDNTNVTVDGVTIPIAAMGTGYAFKTASQKGAKIIGSAGTGPLLHPSLPKNVFDAMSAAYKFNHGNNSLNLIALSDRFLSIDEALFACLSWPGSYDFTDYRVLLSHINRITPFLSTLLPYCLNVAAVDEDDGVAIFNPIDTVWTPNKQEDSIYTTIGGLNTLETGSTFGRQVNLTAAGDAIPTEDLPTQAYIDAFISQEQISAPVTVENEPLFGGTSFASPYATGIAGLIASVNTALTIDQISSILTIHGASRSTRDAAYRQFFQNAGMANAGKSVAAARSTLATNIGKPIPYVQFMGEYNNFDITNAFPYNSDGNKTIINNTSSSLNAQSKLSTLPSVTIPAYSMAQFLIGPIFIELDGFCELDPISGENKVAQVELLINGKMIYSGKPKFWKATATVGVNHPTIIAKTTNGTYTSETYTDIYVGDIILEKTIVDTTSGTLTITPNNPNSRVFYTTDGTFPDIDGAVSAQPIIASVDGSLEINDSLRIIGTNFGFRTKNNKKSNVILGNAPILGNCTVKIFQPILKWRDDAIVCTAIKGSLTGLSYLFVTNGSGNTSNGFEVKIEWLYSTIIPLP